MNTGKTAPPTVTFVTEATCKYINRLLRDTLRQAEAPRPLQRLSNAIWAEKSCLTPIHTVKRQNGKKLHQ